MSKMILMAFLLWAEMVSAQGDVFTKILSTGDSAQSIKSLAICNLPEDPNMDLQSYLGAASWSENPRTGTQQLMRSLLYINVSSIPPNAIVLKAELYLFANPKNYMGNVGNPMYGDKNEGLLEMAKSSWDTTNAQWAGQPSTGRASPRQIKRTLTTFQNDTVDITEFVKSWVNDPTKNYGMVMRLAEEKAYRKIKVLHPAVNASFRPATQALAAQDPLNFSVLANSRIYYNGAAPDSLQPRLVVEYRLPEAFQFNLYPIPASGYLTLSITAPESGTAQLQVVDASGRQVTEQSGGVVMGSNSLNIEGISSLPSGMYWLIIRIGQQKTVKKFAILK
jgi:hypothetical protein